MDGFDYNNRRNWFGLHFNFRNVYVTKEGRKLAIIAEDYVVNNGRMSLKTRSCNKTSLE
ncbi:hypothetical protein LPO01_03390 [Ligilactobacillus pobuzihii]|nr:hypothetical protein LPO01_03390 [Ligilactobacillus pobuzihii]